MGKLLIGLYLGKSGVTESFAAAGSLVVLLAWVYYAAQVFLLGAEFTKVYADEHGSKSGAKAMKGTEKTAAAGIPVEVPKTGPAVAGVAAVPGSRAVSTREAALVDARLKAAKKALVGKVVSLMVVAAVNAVVTQHHKRLDKKLAHSRFRLPKITRR